MADASPSQDCGIVLLARKRCLSNQSCTIYRITAAAIRAAEVEARWTLFFCPKSKGMHKALCIGMTVKGDIILEDGFP